MESTTEHPSDSKSRIVASGTVHGFGRKQGNQFLSGIEAHAPWEAWAEKLADRKRPLPLRKLVHQQVNPLQWALHKSSDAATIEHLALLDGLKRHWNRREPADWSAVVTDWLAVSAHGEINLSFAMESLAWTHALSRLAIRLPAEVWWDLFAFLLNTAVESTQVLQSDLDRPDDALLSQLLAGECSLTLAYCLPRVEVCADLASEARQAIAGGIVELLDGEGMPHARYIPQWRSLLACWTRCMYLDKQIRHGRIKKKARLQYEWLVRQTLRWRRADGSLVFEDGMDLAVTGDSLFKAALEIGGDDIDQEVYDCATGKRKASESRYELPSTGEHSEWGEAAVLRSTWSPRSTYLGVTFNSSRLVTELGNAENVIWSGDDVPEIRVNHEALRVVSEWEELCWCSDEDVDYIELELRFSGNFRLQRQMLLAREDRFVFSADALIGTRDGKIDYCRNLPLHNGVELKFADETTEIGIKSRRNHGWMMPLALSEWQADRSAGQFDGFSLRQQALGQALYAPLFVDLCPKRWRKARTWRQLTVGCHLELVARDQAVAYRVQVGREQWLIYRSLTPVANRTFMGQNVNCEFFVGRFYRDGELDELIEIE